ncbi:MAG: hypothetical protein Q9191_001347 [Dirinaria sp. TL-2023a]
MSLPTVALGIITVQLTTTSTVVGFTSKESLLRPAALVPMVLYAYSQQSCVGQIQHPAGRAFLGAASIFLVFLYVDVALLNRWAYDAKGPTARTGGLVPVQSSPSKTEWVASKEQSAPEAIGTILDRLRFGFSVSLQGRFTGTKWPVKNVPLFSPRDPNYVPGRVEFILRNTLKSSVYVFILRLSSSLGNPKENPVLFSPSRIPFLSRLWEVSTSEIITRVLSVLGYWVVQYMVIEVLYSFLAVSAVALRITDVDAWPPVFGSVMEAWSIRQYWG